VTETLKIIVKVFCCDGDEPSCSIITSGLLTMHFRVRYLKAKVMILDFIQADYVVELILLLFSNTVSAININQPYMRCRDCVWHIEKACLEALSLH
jgi:hypothetical protein